MEPFVMKLIEFSISVAVLASVSIYYARRNEKKDEYIKEMHKEFVTLVRENVVVMWEVQKALTELATEIRNKK